MDRHHIGDIRVATLDDVPDVLSIFQQCDPYFVSKKSPNAIGLLDVIDWVEAANHQHPFFVFEKDGHNIGWCSLEPFYGLPEFDGALEISLYVHPEWQGKGIGKQFIQHLEIHQNSIGFTHLIAYIYADNMNSQHFFEKQHFQQWGAFPNIAYRNNHRESVFLFGREF